MPKCKIIRPRFSYAGQKHRAKKWSESRSISSIPGSESILCYKSARINNFITNNNPGHQENLQSNRVINAGLHDSHEMNKLLAADDLALMPPFSPNSKARTSRSLKPKRGLRRTKKHECLSELQPHANGAQGLSEFFLGGETDQILPTGQKKLGSCWGFHVDGREENIEFASDLQTSKYGRLHLTPYSMVF
mmetsp:Transcript_15723/g.31338  ORF Transcript_15723/g.31338 Transcript_15723/m.31338 type:complete len:191 (+) Transcript_15723:110-682(+)